MEAEYLTKEQIMERITTLEKWITAGSFPEMEGTARKEIEQYRELFEDLKEPNEKASTINITSQMYQQIGILL